MAKQYTPKREEKVPEAKSAAKAPASEVASGKAAELATRKAPERRASDRGHAGQLLWSFAVAICLILAALLQWTAPKNALLEQDRAPAQIRFENGNTSLNGS